MQPVTPGIRESIPGHFLVEVARSTANYPAVYIAPTKGNEVGILRSTQLFNLIEQLEKAAIRHGWKK